MNLVDYRNRVLVFLQWGWSYLTYDRTARLITGTTGETEPAGQGGLAGTGEGKKAASK